MMRASHEKPSSERVYALWRNGKAGEESERYSLRNLCWEYSVVVRTASASCVDRADSHASSIKRFIISNFLLHLNASALAHHIYIACKLLNEIAH